ncbi:MAG: serine/threonine-protein kinase [Pseudomonadota bacterium]
MAELPDIPGYRLKKLLGRGGMATVFLAEPVAGGARVAIKVLHASPGHGDEREWSERFLREGQILTRFDHPNIVRVFAAGKSGTDHYMVMEYLDHGDLTTWIRQGLQPPEALRLLRTLALALDYAHEKGYVHRDVKPDNVLFRADGSPVLTDFGVARQRASDPRLTQIGTTIGTPRYMSPEQHRGGEVDRRSDIYSLGVILYEMLTREVPFDGPDSMSIGIKHLQDPVPQLPARFARYQRLLEGMLEKQAKDRLGSGKSVVKMIDAITSQPETAAKHAILAGEVRQRGLVVRETETKTGFMKKACDIAVAVGAEDYEHLQKHWTGAVSALHEWHGAVGKNARNIDINLFVHPWILARAQDVVRKLLRADDFAFLHARGASIRIHDLDGVLEQELKAGEAAEK